MMMRALLRFFAALLAALLLSAYGSYAAAQTRYEFFLDGVPLPSEAPPFPSVLEGSGFFTVDDASIPPLGAASVDATSFEGAVGSVPFGYSRGSTDTSITLVDFPEPPHEVVTVIETPTHAIIDFMNHVPVGIRYEEHHFTSVSTPPCQTSCAGGYQLELFGSGNWFFSTIQDLHVGTIRFASPIPEPATIMLMLSGLVLVALNGRRSVPTRPKEART